MTLFEAVAANDINKVKALVEAGVDINIKAVYGSTALTWAIRNGYLDIVNYLKFHQRIRS